MNILITGATGLIGRNLLKRIEGDGCNIYVFARNNKKLLELKKEFPKIKIIIGDISDEQLVKRSLKNVNFVYHLAAMRAIGNAEKDVMGCINTNVIGTNNLLKHFKGYKFVTLSTDKAVQIKSVYGASKFMVERLVMKYVKENPNRQYIIVRSGNVFGSTDSVMSVWKDALLNKKLIKITDPYATRYFCTVDEVIDSIIKNRKESKSVIVYPKLKSVILFVLLKAMEKKYGVATQIKTIGQQLCENTHELIKEDGIRSDHMKSFYTEEQLLKLI